MFFAGITKRSRRPAEFADVISLVANPIQSEGAQVGVVRLLGGFLPALDGGQGDRVQMSIQPFSEQAGGSEAEAMGSRKALDAHDPMSDVF